MHGERGRERKRMVWLPLFAAIILAMIAFPPARAGVKLVVDEAGISFEMTAPFFQMAFDFGQVRSKMNSARVVG